MGRVKQRHIYPASFIFLSLLVFLTCLSITVKAHFLLNLNVRIIHVEHMQDSLRVYLRLPMPYLVADKLGPDTSNGLPEAAPFTTNQIEEGALVHYVDYDQVRSQPLGLGEFAVEGFTFKVKNEPLSAIVEDVRIHRVGSQPDFATLEEAKTVFNENQSFPVNNDAVYVGDAIVDIVLRYQHHASVYTYEVSSSLDPSLPEQENTANLILDYSPGNVQVFRERGLLTEPILISRSAFSAFGTFVKEGVRHILEGLDHVLFVICLVLGATQLRKLFWRVTGFTIGHSITLSVGFFGFVPSGAWFVPTVEAGIAISIIYAAMIAIIPRFQINGHEKNIVAVTSAIGLLHGLGFSFVLHNILQITSPNIWQSLLAFNVGVEIGQILIVVIVWLLLLLLRSLNLSIYKISRRVVALACILIASVWTLQRVAALIGMF